MKCTNCNNEQDSGNFCHKCGNQLQAMDRFEEDASPQYGAETATAATTAQPTANPAPHHQSNSARGSFISEFLNFDKMITPSLIKIIFWVGTGFMALVGIFVMISGMAMDFGGGFVVFLGLIIMLTGPFTIRIYSELLILSFKIHETLQDIRRGT